MSIEEKQEQIEMLKAESAYYKTWIRTISQPLATTVDADYHASSAANRLGFEVAYFADKTISLSRPAQTHNT